MDLKKEKNKKTQGIQSLENAFLILDVIKNSSDTLTLSEISHLTAMSKSRVQKYIISFLRIEALVQNKKDQTYSFGPKLLEYGLHTLGNYDIVKIAEPYLKEITNELNQTSALNIWTQKGPVVVKSELSEQPISVSIQTGYRPPLYDSATGKCFLAFMSLLEIKGLTDSEKQQYNINKEEIEEEFKQIRRNGYAFRDTLHERVPGGGAIACPVFNKSEGIAAVISIIGFSESINPATNSQEVQKLKKITSRLSEELYYS